MMDLVTPWLLVGVSCAHHTLRRGTPLLRRWLTLRSRAHLTRAAAKLPAGVRVEGRDSAGAWSASRES